MVVREGKRFGLQWERGRGLKEVTGRLFFAAPGNPPSLLMKTKVFAVLCMVSLVLASQPLAAAAKKKGGGKNAPAAAVPGDAMAELALYVEKIEPLLSLDRPPAPKFAVFAREAPGKLSVLRGK